MAKDDYEQMIAEAEDIDMMFEANLLDVASAAVDEWEMHWNRPFGSAFNTDEEED